MGMMSAAVLYGLVILSAIAHATWNAMMKSAGDRTLTMVAIRTVGLAIGLAALPFVGWPDAAGWKWLAATSVVQFAYYALLIRSYALGDMSVVYPLSRGVAPVLTTLAAFLFAGELLSAGHLIAVGSISLGIMVLSFRAGASGQTVGFALATGATVAAYSFLGGMGVRAAGTVLGFQACLEIVNGVGMVGFALATRPRSFAAYVAGNRIACLLAGLMSVVGFVAFLVAAKVLPLGPTTALRETSVIFGALIGTLILKEGFGPRRIVAASLVAAGIAVLAILR
ncbi:MAG TPA: DMT family transporter [Reyranella sp.]|nr:DMT family transporter [Reyranella sp.]